MSMTDEEREALFRIASNTDKMLAEMQKPESRWNKLASAVGVGAGITSIVSFVEFLKRFFGG